MINYIDANRLSDTLATLFYSIYFVLFLLYLYRILIKTRSHNVRQRADTFAIGSVAFLFNAMSILFSEPGWGKDIAIYISLAVWAVFLKLSLNRHRAANIFVRAAKYQLTGTDLQHFADLSHEYQELILKEGKRIIEESGG